ncbi:MAG TPA: DUF3147 family protein [Acidimicrobiales bacterium]|nr:DUF3147 family protein [Acidimicrobiales bacterium]
MPAERRPVDLLPSADLSKIRGAKPKELLVRFALGAAVSVLAGIISKGVGPRLGGVFLAFPAILPASLTFVQGKEGTHKADRDAIGAVLGGLALVVFATVAESTFTRLNPALVLLCSLAGWLLACATMYVILAAVRPDDCDRTKD